KIAECEFAPFKVENITDLDISEKRNDSRMSWIDGEYLMKKHDTTLFFPKKLDVTKPLYDKDSYDLRKETYQYRLQSWHKEYRIICVKNNRENLNFVKTDIFIFNVGDIPEDCVSTFDISLIDLGVESNILLKDAFSIVFLKGIDFSVPLFTTAGLFESEDASLIINLKVVFNSVGVLQVVQYGSGAGGDGGRPIREKVITFPSQINNELPIFDLNNYPVKVASYNFSLSQEYFSNYNIFCVDNSNPATADDVTLTTINITNVNYIPFDAYSTFDITIIGLDGNTFLNRSFVINFYFFEISAFGIAFQFKPSDSNLGSNPICYSLVFSKNEIVKINDNSINSVNGSAVRNSLDVENPLMNILSVVNPVNKKTLLRYNFDEIIGQNYVTFPGQIDKTKPIEDFSNYNPRFNEFVFSLLNIKHLEMSFVCVNNNGVGGAGGELLTDINIFNVSSIPSGKVFVCNFVIYQGNDITTELGKAFTFNFYAGVDKTSALLYTTFGEVYQIVDGQISFRISVNKYGLVELDKYGLGGGGGVVDAPTIVNLSVENPQKNARLKLNDDGSKFFVEVDGGGGGGSVIPSEIVDNATVLTENQKYYDWAFDSVSANLTWMDKKTFTPAEASLIMADYPRPVYALQDGKNLELKNLEFYALRNFEGRYYTGSLYMNSAYFRRFGIILDVTGLTNKFVSVTWRNLLIGTGGGYYNGTLFPLATTITNNYDMYKMDNSVTNAWYIWFNNNQSDNNIMFLSWENSSGYDSSNKLIVQVEDNKLFVNQNGWYYGSGAIQNIIPASRNYIGRADILVRSEFDKNIVCISKITILDKNGNWGSVGTSSDVYLSGAGLVGEIECVLRVMCGGYNGVYYIFFNGSNVKAFNHPKINNIGVYDFPVRVSATKITFLTEPSFETILIQNIVQEITNINNAIEESKVVELSSRKNS
ncbi:MAG: hypothetical protein EBS86_08780, partial [Crocinitomicaceae bacterium]|nr:hypothetical protein [Crocinitomicaceae bacterium]